MKKWRLIAGILLVFILGLVAGSWGAGMFLRHRMDRFREDPATRKAAIMDRFDRRLKLTNAQRTVFERIINETEKKAETSRQQHDAKMSEYIEESFSQMARILNPEQRAKLDAFREELEKRREEWEKKSGGKDRMPPPPHHHPPMNE